MTSDKYAYAIVIVVAACGLLLVVEAVSCIRALLP